jgi:hypothetical protein
LIYRWLTTRSRDDDVPASPQSRGGLERLLEEQYSQSPKEELFEGRARPDTYTWHNGKHRGVVWSDKRRDLLWLVCFADGHDSAYDLARDLADEDPERDQLYPTLDPDFDGHESAAAWGEFPDEDMLEWIRLAEGAAVASEASREGATGPFEFGAPVALVRLTLDDGIWTFTLRRQLCYASADRDRFLDDEEMLDLVRQLTGDPDDDLVEAHVPPRHHGFVNFHVAADPVTGREWLQDRMNEMTAGSERRGFPPTQL